MARTRRLSLILLVCLLLAAAGASVFVLPHWLGEPPAIEVSGPRTHLGTSNKFVVTITAQGLGLAKAKAEIIQGSQSHVLWEKDFSGSKQETVRQDFSLEPKKFGVNQGQATLLITARDASFGDWFQGKQASFRKEYTVDTTPPRLSLLNRMIHINRGGTGLAVYSLSKDALEHGVTVGARNFKGYKPFAERPDLGLCFFAFSQDERRDAPLSVWAKDGAGNQALQSLPAKIRWKRFRKDKINLSDQLLARLAARMTGQMPKQENNLQDFIYINTKLRTKNNNLLQGKAKQTTGQILWHGIFDRPRGKPMARFGDRRTYFYQGKEVSKAVHLGYDLADVAQSPIPSAADGIVTFAGQGGIYGNCVIVDHGLGLSTLYGHLTRAVVKPGDKVKKGQRLGDSGATGLALGDHLHFSVLVGGVFVNPTEWWDSHWIKDNITLHLSGAGVKP